MYYVIADVLTRRRSPRHAKPSPTRISSTDAPPPAGMRSWSRATSRLPAPTSALADLRDTLAAKISEHQLFRLAARPKALSPLILSRYEPGMEYGTHVDDALMNGMRTDVSFTLFLSDPESYEGGALVIESTGGEEDVKLPAGSLVAYPSTTLHRVAPVTRGVRLAAVGWARSFVRDAGQARAALRPRHRAANLFKREGKTADFDLLSKTSTNLLRMWAED